MEPQYYRYRCRSKKTVFDVVIKTDKAGIMLTIDDRMKDERVYSKVMDCSFEQAQVIASQFIKNQAA